MGGGSAQRTHGQHCLSKQTLCRSDCRPLGAMSGHWLTRDQTAGFDPACVETQSLRPNEKYLESNGPAHES